METLPFPRRLVTHQIQENVICMYAFIYVHVHIKNLITFPITLRVILLNNTLRIHRSFK